MVSSAPPTVNDDSANTPGKEPCTRDLPQEAGGRVHGDKIVRKRVASLKPSPENRDLYDRNDEDIQEFARRFDPGKMDPLVVTLDNYIVSGHRRHAVLTRRGTVLCNCRVLPRRRGDMPTDEYIALLRDYNRQRDKTAAEKVREALVDVDPDEAHENLLMSRLKSVHAAWGNGVEILEVEGSKRRYEISEKKADHVKYILQIVEERKPYWPLTVRGVHYPLLNFEFIRGYYWPRQSEADHGTRRTLYYRNDQGSYDATSDLITRLRLSGLVPWEAFTDPTRPVQEFRAFKDVRQFITQDLERLFTGYWRDLLQSQPNHIEVLVEKNTVYHMALQVTEKYQVPTRSARGLNSIDSFHDIAEAYRRSGKERLVLITLSDWDPEGQLIPHDAGRRLRDDFDIWHVDIIPAGVTRQQIEKYGLPTMNLAKESSSNYDWFVQRNGDDTAWELEALDPADMQSDLDHVIRSVLDIGLFNQELEEEKRESAVLEAHRRTAVEALRGLGG
jgi:hypothetical protein